MMTIGTRVTHRYTGHPGTIVASSGLGQRTVRWDGGGIGTFFTMDLKEARP